MRYGEMGSFVHFSGREPDFGCREDDCTIALVTYVGCRTSRFADLLRNR